VRIAIVAGEASGDLLGAGLIRAMRQRLPQLEFEGVAGPQMIEAGCRSLYPADELAVMGLVEVLGRFRRLLAIRRELYRRYRRNPPDLFIGIDAPDFNIGLERRLKRSGIATVHYVSPSVWAWRRYRIPKIRRATDLLLTLFPFETDIFGEYGIHARFVGHPLADMIPLVVNQADARRQLDIRHDAPLIALLPGSRVSEVRQLAEIFVQAAAQCRRQDVAIRFICPTVDSKTAAEVERAVQECAPQLPVQYVQGEARLAMAASDVVLCASGTATLEAMLLKKPMVVAYRMSPLTYSIVRRLVKVRYISLPNLLAGQDIVPEFIQHRATPKNLADALLAYLHDGRRREELVRRFTELHEDLRMNASAQAASAVGDLLTEKGLLEPGAL